MLTRSIHDWLQAVFAVAETVWKRVMDRMLKAVLIGGACLALAMGFVCDFGPGELRIALVVIDVFASVLLIFVGTTEIPRDLVSRNIQFFLSKPLSRGKYVAGKFLGVLMLGELVFVTYALCLWAAVAIRGLAGGETVMFDFLRMTMHITSLSAVLVALSVCLPEVAATIFGVASFVLSFVLFLWPAMVRVLVPEWGQPILMSGYYLLPNAQHYFWADRATQNVGFVALAAGYSAAYCVFILLVAELWFRRRDLN